ncbi:MAG: GH3 auxin-responsive promoter family protein, partial [Chloroflexota bacterium]
LAITSHFFEFLPAPAGSPDPAVQPRLAHQLEKSQTYTVVVTTGGGFYRYQLQDLVEMAGFVNQTPCIRFVGKTDRVSDWFGEKLDEQFVASALARVFSERCLSPRFAMLAPDDSGGFRYTLYLELPPGQRADNLHHDLDQALSENFHYAYCRKLGQLAEPRIALVVGGADAYLRACQQRGQKLGNIKPALLDKATGWDRWFEPLQKNNGSRE